MKLQNIPSFTGLKPIEVTRKNNQNMKYLFNHMDDIVKKHHIPSTFEMNSGRIILDPPTKGMAKAVTESIKKMGIVISGFKK